QRRAGPYSIELVRPLDLLESHKQNGTVGPHSRSLDHLHERTTRNWIVPFGQEGPGIPRPLRNPFAVGSKRFTRASTHPVAPAPGAPNEPEWPDRLSRPLGRLLREAQGGPRADHLLRRWF